jgi:hypothetical protein
VGLSERQAGAHDSDDADARSQGRLKCEEGGLPSSKNAWAKKSCSLS